MQEFEKLFNRKPINFKIDYKIFREKNILITGWKGSIGRQLLKILKAENANITALDIESDLTKKKIINKLKNKKFDFVFHLAADKRATTAESYPEVVSMQNIIITKNILNLKFKKLIFASTCKAADPITSTGSSKLICERMVLHAGGTVVRFVNVFDSNFSVTRIWKKIKSGPIPVTDTKRFFIRLGESVDLMLKVAELKPHRYCIRNLKIFTMKNVARKLYPNRKLKKIELRLGDRPVEKLVGSNEREVKVNNEISRIIDCWGI